VGGEATVFLVMILVWSFVWGVIGAWLAGEKGRNEGTWFLLGFLFSWLALVILAVAPSLKPQPVAYYAPPSPDTGLMSGPAASSAIPVNTTKKCPDCAEQVLAEAHLCRFCRHVFPETPSTATVLATSPAVSEPFSGHADYGRWSVTTASHGFPKGVEVILERDEDQVLVASGTWAIDVDAQGMAARCRDGILLLSSRGVQLALAPLDGQSTSAVAAVLR
jgi:hypothetical protein